MITIRAEGEIDESYIIELHETRCEWAKVLNAIVDNSLSQDELTNLILLTDYYCKTIPPLNSHNVNEDLGNALKGVYTFLEELIDTSEETYGELSESAKLKIDHYSSTVNYIIKRMEAIRSIEKALD